MVSQKPPLRYQTFLLRIWEERTSDVLEVVYRFSLESPHTRKRQGFADLEQLTAFLLAMTRPEPDQEAADPIVGPSSKRTKPGEETER
jgi:hypothetical protein